MPKLPVLKNISIFPLKQEFMIIRKGPLMTAVLGLIQELADFEKEPDAVLITVDDLVRDGFSFISCLRS
jgi:hypothetical protein